MPGLIGYRHEYRRRNQHLKPIDRLRYTPREYAGLFTGHENRYAT